MSGFDNENVYADGIDLSGDVVVTNKLGTDGFLYIGNSSGNPVASLLTSSDSSIIWTAGSGSLSGIVNTSSLPTIATSYVSDSGTATPSANVLNTDGGTGMNTSGSGNNLTFNIDSPVIVANGGTGAITLGDGFLLLGSGTGVITALDVTAKGSIVVGDGTTDPVALAVGSNDEVLTADSSEASGLKWAAASGGGGFLQQIRSATSAVFNLAVGIPYDDTIPQQTEGVEILTVTITPTATDSILLVEVSVTGVLDATSKEGTGAIFRDTTASAIAASALSQTGQDDPEDAFSSSIRVFVTSGSTDATTFKLRCGSETTFGMSINGDGANRRYGGVAATMMTVTEYSA